MFYAISYDIVDNRRRHKVSEILKDYGVRVQLSVFETLADGPQIEELIRRVKKELEDAEDSVRIYPLCAGCKDNIRVLGQGNVTHLPDFIII
jgi:CRISPR-associated protein Cas2